MPFIIFTLYYILILWLLASDKDAVNPINTPTFALNAYGPGRMGMFNAPISQYNPSPIDPTESLLTSYKGKLFVYLTQGIAYAIRRIS